MAGAPLDPTPGVSTVAGTVRIRRPPWQFVPVAGLILLSGVNATRMFSSSHRWLVLAVITTMVLALERLSSLRWGVDLTPTHLISRWGGRRAISWERVQGFTVREAFTVRLLDVVSDDGRVRRLWAPYSFLFVGRRCFNVQAQVIGQWWVDHRGPGWEPMPVSPWGGAAPSADAATPTGLPPIRNDPWIRLKRAA